MEWPIPYIPPLYICLNICAGFQISSRVSPLISLLISMFSSTCSTCFISPFPLWSGRGAGGRSVYSLPAKEMTRDNNQTS